MEEEKIEPTEAVEEDVAEVTDDETVEPEEDADSPAEDEVEEEAK